MSGLLTILARPLRGRGGAGGLTAPPGLSTSLAAAWALDEASGDRVDRIGGNNLSVANAPGATAGQVGNAVVLQSASPEYLYSYASGLETSDQNFTLSLWVYLPVLASLTGIAQRFAGDSAFREWTLAYRSDWDVFFFRLYNSSGGGALTVRSGTGISAGQWYHLVAWVDGNLASLAVNDGGVYTETGASGLLATRANSFVLGRYQNTIYADAWLDEAYLWTRVLTPAERTYLYQAGLAGQQAL